MGMSETTYFEQRCAQLGRRPPMTEAEEKALARRWLEQKDRKAAEALVEAHLPLVLRQARKLRGYGVSRDELIAEGNVGLLRAVEKFDLRGVRFKTYATYWIRAHMLALAMRSNSIVTVATGALGARFFFKLRSARAKAEALLGPGHEGIDALLAQQFGVTEDVIRQHSARLGSHDLSLDVKLGDDSDTTALDLLESDDANAAEALEAVERDQLVHDTVQRVWKALDERERAVLKHRLLSDDDEVTLSDLGQRFALSRERLRQIELRVKERLKRALDTASNDSALLQ
jgi:RNA polymerase sigma-32 factor